MGILGIVLQGLGVVVVVLAVLVAAVPLTDPLYSVPIGVALGIGGLIVIGIGAVVDLLSDLRRR